MALLALAPCLLASLAHLGSGSADPDACLPNAIPNRSRHLLLDGGRELPLGVWALRWSSGWITAWIFEILASEVLGIRTAMDSGGTSFSAAYAVAGCLAPAAKLPDAQCEGAAFTEFHVAMETWMTTLDERAMSALAARAGSRQPRVVGSIGYEGKIFFAVLGDTFKRAWNERGVPLDYYMSYNRTWQEPSAFFLPGGDIGAHELQPCNATRISRQNVLEGYLAATGDEGGVVRRPDGQLAPRCFDGVWWRSPACRDEPERCVPLVEGEGGYDVQFLMSSTSYLGMPVQIGVAGRGFGQTLPLRGRGTLFSWWFPDDAFATREARQVVLPPHDKDEWARGEQRTSGSAIPLAKLAAASLEAAAPRAFRMLEAFSLSSARVKRILEEHASSGRTHRQSACAWLRANEDVWRPWIPLDNTCVAGEGMADSAGQFVHNASLAVSCKRCAPGCFSDPLGGGAARTHRCQACPTGSISNYFGATQCEQCPPGTKSAAAAAPASPSEHHCGSDDCTRCPMGTFQPAYGGSACVSCSVWLLGAETPFEGALRASDCRCPEGRHRVRGAPGQPHRCAACGEGSGLLCVAGLGLPQQADGFFAREASVVEELDAGLLRLSDGAAGGRVLAVEPKMVRCESPAKCPSGLALGRCPPHSELLACEACEAGYVWQGTRCEECSGGDGVRSVIAASVAAAAGVAAAYVGTRVSAAAGNFDSRAFMTSLGVVVNCLQAVSSISALNVGWVEPMASVNGLLSVLKLNMDILRSGCLFQTNSVALEYVTGLILPLYFVGVVLVALGMLRLARRRVKASYVFNALGSTLMMFFLSMAVAAFVPLECIDNPDGTSSVASFRSVLCWSGEEHAALVGMAAAATLLYVCLPIAIVATVTVQYPRKMVQPGWQEFSARWRFTFSRFHRRCYYYGILHMLRSLAIAVIPLTSADSTQVQIMLLVGVTALSSSVQSLLQPWCTNLANLLDFATSLMLIAILLGSAMLLPSLDAGEISVLQVMFAFVAAGLCLIVASPIVWAAYVKASGGSKYSFFLSHYKEEAECRARYWKLVVQATSPRSKVFLDSDNLQDLDTLFETVAKRTRHLVVLVSPGVLARPWCAGEIAIAHQHRVSLVPVVFEAPWPLDSEGVEAALAGLGPQGTALLAGKGISLVQIRDAYQAFCGAQAIFVEDFSERSYDQAIVEMRRLGKARRPMAVGATRSLSENDFGALRSNSTDFGVLRSLSAEGGPAAEGKRQLSLTSRRVGLLASSEDPEAVAVRGIVCRMLRTRWHGEVEAFPAAAADRQRDFKSVVVLLTRGALRDPAFAAAVSLAVEAGLPVIPAKAHRDFEFPNAAFYQRLEAGLVFDPDVGIPPEGLAAARLAYQRVFKIITVTLSIAAPMQVLEAEVEELHGRLRALKAGPSQQGEPDAAGGGPAEAAELRPPAPLAEDWEPMQWIAGKEQDVPLVHPSRLDLRPSLGRIRDRDAPPCPDMSKML